MFFLKHFTFFFALKDQKLVEIREKSDTQFSRIFDPKNWAKIDATSFLGPS